MSPEIPPNLEAIRCPMCGAALGAESTKCAACGELAQPVEPSKPAPRFRWRIIPTFFLGCMALSFLLVALGQVLMALVNWQRGASGLVVFQDVMIGLSAFLPAITWGAAARFWWRGRWRWAVAGTIIGYFAGLLSPWLAGKL